MWQKIKQIIQDHDTFVITTHVNPDGDGVGAGAALLELLIQMGKKATFVSDSTIPAKFLFLNFHGLFQEYKKGMEFPGAEVLFVLDTHRKDRIGSISALTEKPDMITVCIDHHNVTETFTPYLALDPHACSVGAMIYALYKECGYKLNQQAAAGIYSSIMCDTGRFSYSSTSLIAHKVAEECIELGVDPDRMYSHIFEHVTLGQFKVLVQAMQRMETYFDNRVVVQQIRKSDYDGLGAENFDIEHVDLEYVHELSKRIEGVECVIILHELPDGSVRVSVRSKTELDMAELMGLIGGGGHQKAAGALWNGSLQEIKGILLDHLREMLRAEARI